MCKNRDLADARRYHAIVCVQGAVLDHLRECYTIGYNKEIRTKEETKDKGVPFYILLEDKCSNYPPRPNLAHIMAIEDDDNNIFTSDEEEDGEEDKNKIDKQYKNEPKADA